MIRKILYIYGYGSSPKSDGYRLVSESLPKDTFEIICMEYSQQDCNKAVAELSQFVRDNAIDLVLGTSLGGFITLCLDVPEKTRRMVVNPCMKPSVELPLLKPRPDHPEDQPASKEMINTYKPYEDKVNNGKGIDSERVKGCFAMDDELLGDRYVNSFRKVYSDTIYVPGEHHITQEMMPLLTLAVREAIHTVKYDSQRLLVSSNYQWRFNRLFASMDFKNYAISKLKYMQGGLTIICSVRQDGSLHLSHACITYGYEHAFNTGLGEFDDFGDIVSISDASPMARDVCYDYVKEHDAILFYLIEKYGLE